MKNKKMNAASNNKQQPSQSQSPRQSDVGLDKGLGSKSSSTSSNSFSAQQGKKVQTPSSQTGDAVKSKITNK